MDSNRYDVIIVGGGIMGSSTAHYLTGIDPDVKVAMVEKDSTYERASTTLSMSNLRIQFSLKENIQISQYTHAVFSTFSTDMAVGDRHPDIQFRPEGNLFLIDAESRGQAEKVLALQRQLGCDVQWWGPETIKKRFPLYDVSRLAGGTFSRGDGHFDAYATLMAYRAKARSQGLACINDEVTGVLKQGRRINGVQLKSGDRLMGDTVVNCAGAWAARVAATVGVTLPVVPVKRQVFAVSPAVKPDGPLPLTVLPSGLYFRTETGGLLLVGKSMTEDRPGFDFAWDDKRFLEVLWPELAEFVPAFDTAKLIRGWAGLYAVNTLDGNAILGRWPELEGFYLANGFSGHGLQQAPAVGRYLAEMILDKPHALDLSIFGPQRILENRPLAEGGLV
jgi:glycine/D-amino acid oxidase-like deaminating enzyme